jgi:hypothetical protein
MLVCMLETTRSLDQTNCPLLQKLQRVVPEVWHIFSTHFILAASSFIRSRLSDWLFQSIKIDHYKILQWHTPVTAPMGSVLDQIFYGIHAWLREYTTWDDAPARSEFEWDYLNPVLNHFSSSDWDPLMASAKYSTGDNKTYHKSLGQGWWLIWQFLDW